MSEEIYHTSVCAHSYIVYFLGFYNGSLYVQVNFYQYQDNNLLYLQASSTVGEHLNGNSLLLNTERCLQKCDQMGQLERDKTQNSNGNNNGETMLVPLQQLVGTKQSMKRRASSPPILHQTRPDQIQDEPLDLSMTARDVLMSA